MTLLSQGHAAQAEPLLRRLANTPSGGGVSDEVVLANAALARALHEQKRSDQARFFAERAAALNPVQPGSLLVASAMLIHAGFFAESVRVCERALKLVGPDSPGAGGVHNNLAVCLAELGKYDEAEAHARRALELDPMNLESAVTLARIYDETGRARELCEHLRTCVERFPQSLELRINLACALLNDASLSPGALRAVHEDVARELERVPPLPAIAPPPPTSPDGTRRPLRIGFLSSDLREHSVAYFFEPLLEAIRLPPLRERVFVAAYSASTRTDAVTARLKSKVDLWRDISRTGDDDAAALIRADAIDVLIDLTGYTQGGRPGIWAHSPAPLQANYLGYPATFGSPRVQLRLVDSLTDPAGADAHASERLIRLDPCFLCYRPPRSEEGAGVPDIRPRDASRPITFASFNAIRKISDECVALWSKVLLAVPEARLLLKGMGFSSESIRTHFARRFERHGVAASRLEFLQYAPHGKQLEPYHLADIGLDPLPYNGTTTTCEALFMSVPVVTLVGQTHHSRVGLSILTNVGLPELAARSEEEFVRIASELARDATRLAEMRAGLRPKLLASALCNGGAFATRLVHALAKAVRESTT